MFHMKHFILLTFNTIYNRIYISKDVINVSRETFSEVKKMEIYKSCFFTGHRNISYKLYDKVREDVKEKICILTKKGVTDFIAGGAYGFDMICAEEVIKMKKRFPHIKLSIFLPCINHTVRWNNSNKQKFEYVRKNADYVINISNEEYFHGCMKLRNQAMAKNALYCIAYYLYGTSGTFQTLNFAKDLERIIVNIADSKK